MTGRREIATGGVPDLRSELASLPVRIRPAPWRDHEHARGFGVIALPFSSGHVLGLRVFPENDFAPFVTVWHRDPDGAWTIHYDAVRPDVACPRYYGPAAASVRAARIRLAWVGPATLRVTMLEPRLDWTVRMVEPRPFAFVNRVQAKLPWWTWRASAMVRSAEAVARRVLGMGPDFALSARMPSGHDGILMPERIFAIPESSARLRGLDLGTPTLLRTNPRIGEVPLTARPAFAIGRAFWRILDAEEYRRTRREVGADG